MEINLKSNVDAFAKELDEFGREQLNFATSLTINKLAKMVVAGEKDQIKETFPTATPFTQRGPGYIPSRKDRLEAVVFLKDVQAEYLEPYEFNGTEIPAGPGNVAMLRPVNIGVNQYGNIPYKKLQRMKSLPNVFSGEIKLKNGTRIGGVFQRMAGKNGGPRLKILVRFSDPHAVHQELHWFDRATKVVEDNFDKVMSESMDYALATKK